MDILILAERLSTVNVVKTLVKILNTPKTKEFITNLNTEVQLFQEGENSFGVKLTDIGGEYSLITKKIKKRKNQPSNRVTLYDTGDFYESFDVDVDGKGDYTINADPMKDGFNLFSRWGEDVTGLNEENQEKVLVYLENEFYRYILR